MKYNTWFSLLYLLNIAKPFLTSSYFTDWQFTSERKPHYPSVNCIKEVWLTIPVTLTKLGLGLIFKRCLWNQWAARILKGTIHRAVFNWVSGKSVQTRLIWVSFSLVKSREFCLPITERTVQSKTKRNTNHFPALNWKPLYVHESHDWFRFSLRVDREVERVFKPIAEPM